MASESYDVEDGYVDYEDLNESDIEDNDGDLVLEQRVLINKEPALKRIWQDLKVSGDLPWPETLDVSLESAVALTDVYDDLSREAAFYDQALKAACIGLQKCNEEGIATLFGDNDGNVMIKSGKSRQAKVTTSVADEKSKVSKRKRMEKEKDQLELDEDIVMGNVDIPDENERKKRYQKGLPKAMNKQVKKKGGKPRRPGKARRIAMRHQRR